MEQQSVVLELAFDLAGHQLSAVLREVNKTELSEWWQACRVCLHRQRKPEADTGGGSRMRNERNVVVNSGADQGLSSEENHNNNDVDWTQESAQERTQIGKMRNIFDKPMISSGSQVESKSTTIADLLQRCANIPLILSNDDNTPQHICHRCERHLYAAIQFRRRCERSDTIFRNAITESSTNDPTVHIKCESSVCLDDARTDNKQETDAQQSNVDETANTPTRDAGGTIADNAVMLKCQKTTTTTSLGERKSTRIKPIVAELPHPTLTKTSGKAKATPRRRFKCQECDSAFSQRYSLTVHMRTHTGERPYVCDICNNAFKTYGAISAHIVTHTNDRNFGCPHCEYRANTRQNLRVHLRTHDDQRAYACDECPARFRTNGNMHKHRRRVHLGERFPCSDCGRSYTTAEVLRKHRLGKHSGQRPFECPVCQRTYGWYTGLEVHMKRHHFGVPLPMQTSFNTDIGQTTTSQGSKMDEDEGMLMDDEMEADVCSIKDEINEDI